MKEAKVVQLAPAAKRSRVRCPETGVVFPQVFRVTGYFYKFKEGRSYVNGMIESRDDLEADLKRPLPPSYTLDQEMCLAPANVRWELLQYLDPSIDTGLVYIRHHATLKVMEAYVDALCDTENYELENRWSSYETEFGCFTLMHRPANAGAPVSCALVYTTKVLDPGLDIMIDWYKVIGPEEEEMTIEDLLPPEVAAQYDSVIDCINALE